MGGNTSTITEVANVDAEAREGRESHKDRHQNKNPKLRINRAPRCGAIAIFAILPPPAREVKSCAKRARVGSIPFGNISKIDI